MPLIKKIIEWIKHLFQIFFGKRKIVKKVKKNIAKARNRHYLKGYGMIPEEVGTFALPIYLMINKEEKEKTLCKVKLLETKILEIDSLNNKIVLEKINEIEERLEQSRISFYQNQIINEKLDDVLKDKKILIDTEKKINSLNHDIIEIMENFDKNIQDKVRKEYDKINFITISTLLLDETMKEVQGLEEDYKHHKYNKFYYEKAVNRIKERIKNLKKVRDSYKVQEEIEKLRHELYTKSKDKYDLLYNDEIFLNVENVCNDLVRKVNRKVIDLKKVKEDKKEEKEKTKKEEIEEKEKKDRWEENVLKRFQDLELARRMLLLSHKEEYEVENTDDLLQRMNNIYFEFLNSNKIIFNFERNKTKMELRRFYNDVNQLYCTLTKQECLFIDHINDKMSDLLEDSISKKKELESLLEEKYHYQQEKHEASILVNNKLNILKEKEEERNKENESKVLVKKNSEAINS